jgi:VWFA-related protein
MKTRAGVLALLGAAVVAVSSFSVRATQNTPQTPPPLVIQVGVDLIQIDATVTDKRGRPITDLRAEDFTLEVDGKRRPLTNAIHFGAPVAAAVSDAETEMDAPQQAAGSEPSPGNTVVFVIDDLNMSFNSMYQARRGLTKFASEWEESRTRAAVRTTSDETMTFTLFNNAPEFENAAAQLRYNIRSNKGIRSVGSMLSDRGSSGRMAAMMAENLAANPAVLHANMRQRFYSLITTINSLRSVPGRKAVVLVSEGFTSIPSGSSPLGSEGALSSLFLGTSGIHESVRLITEVANRASVVLYAVDPRGLMLDGPSASEDPTPNQLTQVVNERIADRIVSQASLQQLADATGGLAIANTNDLRGGFGDVLRDQAAYYLIGFEPPYDTFARKWGRPRFHKIKLKVNRPNLRVRTREGFYGVTDQEVNDRAPVGPIARAQ